MAACSHGAGYVSCPPEKVAKEFNQADKGTGVLKKKPKDHDYHSMAKRLMGK